MRSCSPRSITPCASSSTWSLRAKSCFVVAEEWRTLDFYYPICERSSIPPGRVMNSILCCALWFSVPLCSLKKFFYSEKLSSVILWTRSAQKFTSRLRRLRWDFTLYTLFLRHSKSISKLLLAHLHETNSWMLIGCWDEVVFYTDNCNSALLTGLRREPALRCNFENSLLSRWFKIHHLHLHSTNSDRFFLYNAQIIFRQGNRSAARFAYSESVKWWRNFELSSRDL